ncbi:hypothetical protein ACFPRL_06440 [Pseudoclavibacter helvolus]
MRFANFDAGPSRIAERRTGAESSAEAAAAWLSTTLMIWPRSGVRTSASRGSRPTWRTA